MRPRGNDNSGQVDGGRQFAGMRGLPEGCLFDRFPRKTNRRLGMVYSRVPTTCTMLQYYTYTQTVCTEWLNEDIAVVNRFSKKYILR